VQSLLVSPPRRACLCPDHTYLPYLPYLPLSSLHHPKKVKLALCGLSFYHAAPAHCCRCRCCCVRGLSSCLDFSRRGTQGRRSRSLLSFWASSARAPHRPKVEMIGNTFDGLAPPATPRIESSSIIMTFGRPDISEKHFTLIRAGHLSI
jgi:hypothetical protein